MPSSPTFTGNETIQEIMEMMPESVEILSMHGLGCVTCGLASVEKFTEGVLAHGYSEEDMKKMLQDLNEAAEDLQIRAKEALKVSALAEEKILTFAKENGTPDAALRIEVIFPPGAEEVTYDLDFQLLPDKEDTVIKSGDVKIFLSPSSYRFLQDATLDFLDRGENSGFEVVRS